MRLKWQHTLGVLGLRPFKLIGVRPDGCAYPTVGTLVFLAVIAVLSIIIATYIIAVFLT